MYKEVKPSTASRIRGEIPLSSNWALVASFQNHEPRSVWGGIPLLTGDRVTVIDPTVDIEAFDASFMHDMH